MSVTKKTSTLGSSAVQFSPPVPHSLSASRRRHQASRGAAGADGDALGVVDGDLDRLVALVDPGAVDDERGALTAGGLTRLVEAVAGRIGAEHRLVLRMALVPLEHGVIPAIAVVGVSAGALDGPERDAELPAVGRRSRSPEEEELGQLALGQLLIGAEKPPSNSISEASKLRLGPAVVLIRQGAGAGGAVAIDLAGKAVVIADAGDRGRRTGDRIGPAGRSDSRVASWMRPLSQSESTLQVLPILTAGAVQRPEDRVAGAGVVEVRSVGLAGEAAVHHR